MPKYGKPIDMGAKIREAAEEDIKAKRKALAKATQDPKRHTGGNKEDKKGEETEDKEDAK